MAEATSPTSPRDRLWEFVAELFKEETRAQENEEQSNIIRAKYKQIVSNLTCLGDIAANMYQNRKLTQKELDDIKALESTPIRAIEELLNIIANKPQNVYKYFLTLLKETNQNHLYQILVTEQNWISDKHDHQESIRRNFLWLSEKLDTEYELVPLLSQYGVLTPRENQQIVSINECWRRNELLLSLIGRKSPENFKKFTQALEETNQSHIVHKLLELKGRTIAESLLTLAFCKKVAKKLRPNVPPKPKIVKWHDTKMSNVKKVSRIKIQNLFNTIEEQLQTEISIKVTLFRKKTTKPGDILKECLGHAIKEFLKMNESRQKQASELDNLRRKSRNLAATAMMNKSFRASLHVRVNHVIQKHEDQETFIQTNENNLNIFKQALNRVKEADSEERSESQELNIEQNLTKNEFDKLEDQIQVLEKEEQLNMIKIDKMTESLKIEEKEKERVMVDMGVFEKKVKTTEEGKGNNIKEYPGVKRRISPKTEARKTLGKNYETCIEKDPQMEIAELKEANEKLKEENQRLRHFLDKQLSISEKQLPLLLHHDALDEPDHDKEDGTTEKGLQVEKDVQMGYRNVSNKPFTRTDSTWEKIVVLAIANNRQFLLENLRSGPLIDLLHSEIGMTDEERKLIEGQPNDFCKIEEVLQWITSAMSEKKTNCQTVIDCLKRCGQTIVAYILENGRVTTWSKVRSKPKISSILGSSSKSRFRSSLEDKEDLLVEKLNQSNESAFLSAKISEIFGCGIEIVSYCRREEDGIVVWFLCHSTAALKRLQKLYASNALFIAKLKTLFRLLLDESTLDSVLIPESITMLLGDFNKQIENRQDHTITIDSGIITAMAILEKEVFIAMKSSFEVEVHDKFSLDMIRKFVVRDMENPTDIVSCSGNKRLYIVDQRKFGQQSQYFILAVDPQGTVMKTFYLGHDSCRLSVTVESNIIATLSQKSKLIEFSAELEMIREIKVRVQEPCISCKLPNGNFVVGFGSAGGICVIDSTGNVVKDARDVFKESDKRESSPICLAVYRAGSIGIAHFGGGVIFLTSNLQYTKVLHCQHWNSTQRNCFDESLGLLYMAGDDSKESWINVCDVTDL